MGLPQGQLLLSWLLRDFQGAAFLFSFLCLNVLPCGVTGIVRSVCKAVEVQQCYIINMVPEVGPVVGKLL